MISRLEALERLVVSVGESLRSLSGRVAALGNQLWQVQAGMQSTFVVPLEYRYEQAPGGGGVSDVGHGGVFSKLA